jgi:hypothetical protein
MGMSSLFVQVTVVPTGTVIVCGPKTKLSIFTAARPAAAWSFAETFRDPANNSSIPIITGAADPAIHMLLFFILCFLSRLIFCCLFFGA